MTEYESMANDRKGIPITMVDSISFIRNCLHELLSKDLDRVSTIDGDDRCLLVLCPAFEKVDMFDV